MDFVALLDQMPDLKESRQRVEKEELLKEVSELREDLENLELEEEREMECQQAQVDYEMYLESMEGEEI